MAHLSDKRFQVLELRVDAQMEWGSFRNGRLV